LTNSNIDANGYCDINRKWEEGDQVKVTFGMEIKTIICHDDSTLSAIAYGPIILAGEAGKVEHPFSNPNLYNDYYNLNFNIPAGIDTHYPMMK